MPWGGFESPRSRIRPGIESRANPDPWVGPKGDPLKGIGPVQPLDRPRRWRVIRPCPPPGTPGRPGHVQPLDRSRRWRVIRPCPHARTPAWPGGGPWGLALAQSGRAPGCSPGGCWFESSRSDPFWISALGSEPSQCNGGWNLIRHCQALQPPGTCGNIPTGIQSLDRIPGSNPQRPQGIPHA